MASHKLGETLMTIYPHLRFHELAHWHQPIVTLAASILFIAAISTDLAAETRLAAGDVVEISVTGVPELRQRSTVNRDGEISLPLIGEVKVIGLPLSEFRAKVRQLLSNKGFRRRTQDGRESIVAIWPDEIAIDIVEYQPVYLTGDVAKPGEQRYRSGMTVRQAIALAGGYDVVRSRAANPLAELADLRGEYQVLWAELAREQASIERLQAELDGKSSPNIDLSRMPIAGSFASEMARLATEQLTAQAEDRQAAVSHLQKSIASGAGQLSILTDQKRRFEEGAAADRDDLENSRELQRKGLASTQRVLDARRSLLWSSSSLLSNIAQISQSTRDHEELKTRLEQVGQRRRIEALRDLETATVKKTTINARLQALAEKLTYNAEARSQLTAGNEAKPEIAIFRKRDNGWDRSAAEEDAELLPGDTIEVTLRSTHIPGLTAR
jgi:polysaccharide biosynthesis/export protein